MVDSDSNVHSSRKRCCFLDLTGRLHLRRLVSDVVLAAWQEVGRRPLRRNIFLRWCVWAFRFAFHLRLTKELTSRLLDVSSQLSPASGSQSAGFIGKDFHLGARIQANYAELFLRAFFSLRCVLFALRNLVRLATSLIVLKHTPLCRHPEPTL